MEKRSYVIWSREEKELVFRKLAEQRVIPELVPFANAVTEVQKEVLPEHRRRARTYPTDMKSMLPAYQAFYLVFTGEVTADISQVQAPVEDPLAKLDLLYAAVRSMLERSLKETRAVKDELAEFRRTMEAELSFLQDVVSDATKPSAPRPVVPAGGSPPPEVKPGSVLEELPKEVLKKPKILIVGAKGNQQNELEREFGHEFELICYHGAQPGFKSHAQAAVLVVLFKKFCRHATFYDLREIAGPRFRLASGGVSSVKRAILDFKNNERKPSY